LAMRSTESSCLKTPCPHLRSRTISEWSSAGCLWPTAMNLQNGYRISPSRSGTANSRRNRPPQLAASFHARAPPAVPDRRRLRDRRWPRINDCFFLLPRRLVATTLLARNRAAIVSFDRGSHHAAVSPWADGDAAWAYADGDV